MKATYQLIGVTWDHQQGEELPANPAPLAPEVSELGSPACLFDDICVRRYVRVSDLLACDDIAEIDGIATRAQACKEVDVLIDYVPCAGVVVQRFFERRVGQAVARLRCALPNANVIVASVG